MVRIAVGWLLVALGSAAGQFRDDASCSDHVIDSCGTDFLVFSKASQLPDTPAKLAASCTEELKSLSCAKDYASRCLLGFTRGAALVAINAVQEEVEGKCDSTHILHRRYFEHVGCMNKAGPGIHDCVRRFQEALFIAASKAPRKVKVPHACCEYSEFYECTERSLRDSCGDPKTIEHVQDTVSNVVGDLLSIVCGRYQRGSADCLALGKLPPLSANQTVPRNLISPLKAIVRSLG